MVLLGESGRAQRVIDFHTHIFPEKIAGATIAKLESVGGIKAHTDGTLAGLKDSMMASGVDLSVVLPVVTKPGQFVSVNRYAAEISERDGIVSFGGVHPDTENGKAEIDEIVSMGLKGIKLHPDYQNVFVDDIRYLRIISYALEKGLLITFHAGVDIGLPEPVHCTPERSLHMIREVGADKKTQAQMIFAHTGGWRYWNEVEDYLVDTGCYLDISFSLDYIAPEQFVRIARSHGTEKILFATDSPWGGQAEDIRAIQMLGLTDAELDRILYRNGAELLNGRCINCESMITERGRDE
ncbi:amidohydrolase family protein [Anaerolentibacter hominis]|uniref:amidohydrolase family protein n=1 Tax=Anaerolentibacter hominis TaxID=3079009 RepID=UPI0031B887BC